MAVGLTALVEGDAAVLAAMLAVIGASGMLAFLVVVGAYLDLVRPAHELATRPRTLLPFVAAAMSVPVAVAFRDHLWWIVGSTGDRAGIGDLALLLVIAAIASFLVALLVTTVRREAVRAR